MRRVILVGWDALGWAIALALASALRADFDISNLGARELLIVVLGGLAAQLAVGLCLQTYRGRHPVGSVDDAVNVTVAMGLVGAILFVVEFFVQPRLIPESVPLLAAPMAVLFAVGSRLAFRLYREYHYRADYSHAQRVIIYGAGIEGQQLMRLMLSDPAGGFLPVALLDDNQVLRRRRLSGVAVRGTRTDVAVAAARSQADLLVIADRTLPADIVREVASAATDAGLRVSMLPSLAELLKPLPAHLALPPRRPASLAVPEQRDRRRRAEDAVDVDVPPAPAVGSRGKRVFDVILSLVVTLVALPLLMLIAGVLLVTGGEVIYRATRIGRDGEPFAMFKFATMRPGGGGPRVTTEGDLRITRVGRYLRVTKLNELPQVFNVIKGDMSLVGPRPEDPHYTALYSARQQRVLAVRPGMTSLAFLRFGDEQAFIERAQPSDVEAFYLQELLPEKLEIELGYVTNWSMREDLRILACTAKRLLL